MSPRFGRFLRRVAHLLGVAAIAAAPLSLRAQTPTGPGAIEGRVVDAATGEPLPGARVVITGTSAETSTDRDGRFLAPGGSIR